MDNAMKHCSAISVINCQRSCPIPEPSTFLIPISFALRTDAAIERLLKLIAPASNKRKASNNKTVTVVKLLDPCLGKL